MSSDKWMDKEDVVYIYNGTLSTIRKNEIMPFAATWMDLEIIILSEIRQRKTNITWYCLYVESKKQTKKTIKVIKMNLYTKKLICKTEIDPLT